MGFKVAASSCENRWVNSYACYTMKALGCRAWFRMGDHPYINQEYGALWGQPAAPALDKDSTVADVSTYYAQTLANPGTALARSFMHLYHMMDDHEWMGEGWDHTYATAQGSNNPIGLTADNLANQNDINAHHAVCRAAFQQADSDNANGVALTTTANIPSGATTHGASPDSSEYVALGYRVGYTFNGHLDNDNPDVDFFNIDCITCRSPISDADSASKTMLGAAQKAAFLAALSASTATYKVIVSNKKFFLNSGGDNDDGWESGSEPGYVTERDEILDHIRDNGITGCFAVSGDRHVHCVNAHDTDNGDSWDFVNVTSAVFSKDAVSGATDANTPFMRSNNSTPPATHGFIVMDFTPTRALIQLRYSNRGADAAPMWEGQVLAGSNKLSYPGLSVGVS